MGFGEVIRAVVVLLISASAFALRASAGEANEATFQQLKRNWRTFSADRRIEELAKLETLQTGVLVRKCKTWLDDKNIRVRTAVVRVVARCATDSKLRVASEKIVSDYLTRHLGDRAKREKSEFAKTCKKYGRRIPSDTEMAAGADWKDPYDDQRGQLPGEILAERIHMRELIASVEQARMRALRPLLMRVFATHHDPEVLVRLVKLFDAWREWRALPAMADLARIQQFGRQVGGKDVVGAKLYETRRLKWDVHKDRLWWSRPEFVPRVSRPITQAASTITGAEIRTARELDGWLLSHESELKTKRVTLTGSFKARARATQR
jgi:hypothetical protein